MKSALSPPTNIPRRIAYHEAGHIVVAHVEGFDIGDLEVKLNMSGTAAIFPACMEHNAERYIRRRIHVLLAGAVAQSACMSQTGEIDNNAVNEALTKGDASKDWDKAVELAWIVRNMKASNNVDPKGEMNTLLDELLTETAQIVKREMVHIQQIANAVILVHDDIDPNDLFELRGEVTIERADLLSILDEKEAAKEVADRLIQAHFDETSELKAKMSQ